MFLGMFRTPVAINHIQYSIFQQYISGLLFLYATEKADFLRAKEIQKRMWGGLAEVATEGRTRQRSKQCHSHESAAGLDLEAGAKCQGALFTGDEPLI